MLIQYYKHVYKCELVNLGGVEFYKGNRLYKNGKLARRHKYFVPGADYYTIVDDRPPRRFLV